MNSCPFCAERDFDLIGLKNHLLNGHCEPFEATERIFTAFSADSATIRQPIHRMALESAPKMRQSSSLQSADG